MPLSETWLALFFNLTGPQPHCARTNSTA